MDNRQVEELVLQSLEQEIEGERIYDSALACAMNPDLRSEWTKYRAETKMHVAVLRQICEELAIDPDKDTPGERQKVKSAVAAAEAEREADRERK